VTSRHSLPAWLHGAVSRALEAHGLPPDIRSVKPLHGGSIHRAARLGLADFESAFLKWSDAGFRGFGVEARGLHALAVRGGVRIPEVLGVSEAEEDPGWLLLEFIDQPESPALSRSVSFARELATLHRPLSDAVPGWDEDGWIGPLPQANVPAPGPGAASAGVQRLPHWPEFWRSHRLLPLWTRLSDRFDSEARDDFDVVLDRTELLLAGWESDGLSLLHGDLWSGNVLTDGEGRTVLVDPAVYRGHCEVDLAMLELFGGFPPGFMEDYREDPAQENGYLEVRRDMYQLYPLLVHVQLFGAAYVPQLKRRIRRLSSAST